MDGVEEHLELLLQEGNAVALDLRRHRLVEDGVSVGLVACKGLPQLLGE